MNGVWVCAPQIFDGLNLHEDAALHIEDGRVTSLRTTKLPPDTIRIEKAGLVTPGFFDIQVNGGGGVLLNTDPTRSGIQTICEAHRKSGTTAILPTVISDRPEVTAAAAEACLKAKDIPGMMGLHIEGPHLSKRRRGTHQSEMIRPMDRQTIGLVTDLCVSGLKVLITVAPEAVTPSQIAQLDEAGAIVSIGHSDASAAEVNACLAAGARCFTHLFNAMSPMLGRAPGVVGAAIASEAWCSIIADGIHVDPTMVALAFRARPKMDRMIAISDAMPTVGGPDMFTLYGKDIHLVDGRLINDEGSLAGAHLTVLEAVRNLIKFGIPLEEALRAGRSNPANLMGLLPQMGVIGCRAEDLLTLTPDLELMSVGLEIPATEPS